MGSSCKFDAKTQNDKSANSISQSRSDASLRSANSPAEKIMFLQRTAGNQAVQKLIKSGALQAKLRIGQPNDIYEQEADRVAEQVISMPEPKGQKLAEKDEEEEPIQAKPIAEQITPLVRRQSEDKEEKKVQTKEYDEKNQDVNDDLESRIQNLKGGGQPLSKDTREFFEPRFGYDFSKVQVHTGTEAAETSHLLNAKAYTVGNNVVLGAGQYSPETSYGKRLLAHELTHVVQQKTGENDGIRPAFLQRDELKYIQEAPVAEANKYLEAFDAHLNEINKSLANISDSEAGLLREAVTRLGLLRKSGYVTCWYTSGKLIPAGYVKGKLRLHINTGSASTSAPTLIHEAVHALQISQYPKLSSMYDEALASGGTDERNIAILLVKWKAWGEYWAYRRQAEYNNLLHPELLTDVHKITMENKDVIRSLRAVKNLTGKDFEPWNWKPPVKSRSRLRVSEKSPKAKKPANSNEKGRRGKDNPN